MRFWDSSALVAVSIPEDGWERLAAVLDERDPLVVWWGTPVEFSSAVVRCVRMGHLDRAGFVEAIERLRDLEARWLEIEPSPELCDRALALLKAYPLGAEDALQLAAALIAADGSPC